MVDVAKLREKGKVTRLIKALSHSDPEVQKAAAEALVELGDERAVQPLVNELWRLATHDDVQRHVWCDWHPQQDRWFGKFMDEFGEPDPAVAVWLTVEQALVDFGEPAVGPLVAALQLTRASLDAAPVHSDRARQNAYAQHVETVLEHALVEIGESAVEPLGALLQKQQEPVQRVAIDALGRIGDARCIPALTPLLRAPPLGSSDLRAPAASALGQIGDPSAVEPLITVLRTKDESSEMAMITGESHARLRAAQALGKIDDHRAVQALSQALSDDDEHVRRAAERALEELGDLPFVEALLVIYVHDPDVLVADLPSGERLTAAACETLARHDSSLYLSGHAYIRAVVTQGDTPMATQEAQAIDDAPRMLKEILDERGLATAVHIEVWTENLAPNVAAVWAAAVPSQAKR